MQAIEMQTIQCRKTNLFDVIQSLYTLSGQSFSTKTYDTLLEKLSATNTSGESWLRHDISIAPGRWSLALALEDDKDVVCVKIWAPTEFQDPIKNLLKSFEIVSN